MYIAKEDLTINEDSNAIYTVQIKDFHRKMKNWPPIIKIRTNKFRVQGRDLRLCIYPNGLNKGFKDHVSAHLWSINSMELFVSFKIQIGDQPEKKVKSSVVGGVATLCNHVKVYPNFRADEELKVVCTIMKLTTDKDVWDLYTEAKVKAEESKTKLDMIETKQEKVKKPPCPICFEEMSGFTKIAQCNNGHLLCWSCKEKMKSNKCPSCRLPVDGRAFGMESYLRSLFGFD